MAFTVDQTNLGTVVGSTSTISSFTLTTGATAASGSIICVAFGWFTVTNTITNWAASGGGLTWTVPIKVGLAPGGDGCATAWALAPAGLASGTVITFTVTPASSMSGPCAVAQSFLGAASSSPQDGTSSKVYTAITSGAWTGTTIAGMTGTDLVFATAWGDANTGTVASDAANTGWTSGPVASQTSAAGGCVTSVYALNVASTPNPNPWGTWGAGAPTGTASTAVAFLPSGAAAAPFATPHLPLMAPQGGIL